MIESYEFDAMMQNAKQRGDIDLMQKLMELHKSGAVNPAPIFPAYEPAPPPKLTLEQNELSQRKTVKINVQVMVENLLGGPNGKRDVQVRLEKYGRTHHHEMSDDMFAFLVVNICNLENGDIITLREHYSKFPSPEFLTKLELLRVGDEVK